MQLVAFFSPISMKWLEDCADICYSRTEKCNQLHKSSLKECVYMEIKREYVTPDIYAIEVVVEEGFINSLEDPTENEEIEW